MVVNAQVTAVVLQFLSFHCGGGCECTGDSFCVCSFRFVSFHEGVVVNVQATAGVLQFLSFREGSGGGCCKCTCDSWFVAVSVIPLWGWL